MNRRFKNCLEIQRPGTRFRQLGDLNQRDFVFDRAKKQPLVTARPGRARGKSSIPVFGPRALGRTHHEEPLASVEELSDCCTAHAAFAYGPAAARTLRVQADQFRASLAPLLKNVARLSRAGRATRLNARSAAG